MKSASRAFLLGILIMLAASAMPASAQRYDQGGVIPGSADDMSFRHGRWVPNRYSAHGNRSFSGTYGRSAHSREVQVYRYRRLVAVRRVAAPAPMVQTQPRARCGGRCVTTRPTCGIRCKPKCSTCGQPGIKQNQKADQKIVVKNVGQGANVVINASNTATQIVGGGSAAARTSTAGQGSARWVSVSACLTRLGLNAANRDFWLDAQQHVKLSTPVAEKLKGQGKLDMAQRCVRAT